VAHILVIDDSEFDRRMIMRALRRMDKSLGFEELNNGSGVLETLAQSRPDLILLDIRMPGPSGFEVLDLTLKALIKELGFSSLSRLI